ncbi:hypothetical protein BSPWISOXPB_6163 [uncultured Gammaproteobacteria bacterium]|nr:hypothetical protein BSPWISOXPB_6163 [uncultured Gammaproteobacteria bacterium]
MKNLDKYVSDSYKLSLDECFGYWIHNGVWYSDEDLTFDEAKEVFFLTLKKLLDDNKVVYLLLIVCLMKTLVNGTRQLLSENTVIQFGGYPVKKSSNTCEMFFQKTLKKKTMVS